MPQIRISDEVYRLLKGRAQQERRSLTNMLEVLLIPTIDDVQITNLARGTQVPTGGPPVLDQVPGPHHADTPPTDLRQAESFAAMDRAGFSVDGKLAKAIRAVRADQVVMAAESEAQRASPPCTCAPAERRRGKGKLGPHKLGCPAREA